MIMETNKKELMTFPFYSLLYVRVLPIQYMGWRAVKMQLCLVQTKCMEPVSRDIVSPMRKSPLERNKVSHRA